MAELTRTQLEAKVIAIFAYERERIVYALIDHPRPELFLRVLEHKSLGPVAYQDPGRMEDTVEAFTFTAKPAGYYSGDGEDFRLLRIVVDGGRHGDVVVWTGMRRR